MATQKNVKTWTAPQLQRVGTVADIAGSSSLSGQAGLNTRS